MITFLKFQAPQQWAHKEDGDLLITITAAIFPADGHSYQQKEVGLSIKSTKQLREIWRLVNWFLFVTLPLLFQLSITQRN